MRSSIGGRSPASTCSVSSGDSFGRFGSGVVFWASASADPSGLQPAIDSVAKPRIPLLPTISWRRLILWVGDGDVGTERDRKSTRLNSSHVAISYAVFCLKK